MLAGHPKFEVTRGSIEFKGQDLLEMEPEDRSREDCFKFPVSVEIPGVSMVNFMRSALNEQRKYRKEEPISATVS